MFAKRLSSRRRRGQLTTAPPGHVARPIHEIGALGGGEETGKPRRSWETVRVHLADQIPAPEAMACLMPSTIGAPNPRLSSMQYLDAARCVRPVRPRPAPVPSGDWSVDDEHADAVVTQQRLDQRREVLALVVGREITTAFIAAPPLPAQRRDLLRPAGRRAG